jgi:hypothetical protein
MRAKLGLMCFDHEKKFIPSFEVFYKGEPVTYADMLPNDVMKVNGDLSNWSSYEKDEASKRLDQRFLGLYYDGDISKLPDMTIICED